MSIDEALKILDTIPTIGEQVDALEMAIKALEQETNIKSLGEDMRICQKSITDDKVLIGFNMAIAICNKYFAGSEDKG